jgi:hypothetical protein
MRFCIAGISFAWADAKLAGAEEARCQAFVKLLSKNLSLRVWEQGKVRHVDLLDLNVWE